MAYSRKSKLKSRKRRIKSNAENKRGTLASPVKVIKPDGSFEIKPAYSIYELRKITGDNLRNKIPDHIKKSVYKRDGRRCRYCSNAYADNYQLDHVIPFSIGGPTTVKNLVVSCSECNGKKDNNIWKPKPLNNF